MMSSVSWVASTAPWPARAWSEWPCVISAFSTGRVGSMWNPPRLQHTPEGVGTRISSGRIALTYVAAVLVRASGGGERTANAGSEHRVGAHPHHPECVDGDYPIRVGLEHRSSGYADATAGRNRRPPAARAA